MLLCLRLHSSLTAGSLTRFLLVFVSQSSIIQCVMLLSYGFTEISSLTRHSWIGWPSTFSLSEIRVNSVSAHTIIDTVSLAFVSVWCRRKKMTPSASMLLLQQPSCLTHSSGHLWATFWVFHTSLKVNTTSEVTNLGGVKMVTLLQKSEKRRSRTEEVSTESREHPPALNHIVYSEHLN